MKVYTYVSLKDFEFWGGACSTVEWLGEEELDQIENILEELGEGKGLTETEINDFFWFETDTIADWLGYENWELYVAELKCCEKCPMGDDSCPYCKVGRCTLENPMEDCDDYATLMSD